jgi:hypothetical protein
MTGLLVEALGPAEAFVVCAARVHRALRTGTCPPCVCLCRIFAAADIPRALVPFALFQAALAADPERSFIASERCSTVVTAAEVRLLEAIAQWQSEPRAPAERALEFVRTAAVRRIAAPAGRAFALEIGAVGLWVRSRQSHAESGDGLHLVH